MEYVMSSKVSMSASLLVPLLGLTLTNAENYIPLTRSYLYWEEGKLSIDNYEMGILFSHKAMEDPKFEEYEENILIKNNYISACYNTNCGTLYTFDLSVFHETVDKFVEGKYSKFSPEVKKAILKYWGEFRDTTKPYKNANLLQTLYPSVYYTLAAEELGVEVHELPKELCPMMDVEIETFKGKKIGGCLEDDLFLSQNSLGI